MALPSPSVSDQTEKFKQRSRRKHPRYSFSRKADWDFYTSTTGAKEAYVENISEAGCLLRASETIEHRRWIRFIVREAENNLWFSAVGRVIRREDQMEASVDGQLTLYRYGIEFVHPLNPMVLQRIQDPNISKCVECGASPANIHDSSRPGARYCVLCHLRRACHNLLVQDAAERA